MTRIGDQRSDASHVDGFTGGNHIPQRIGHGFLTFFRGKF